MSKSISFAAALLLAGLAWPVVGAAQAQALATAPALAGSAAALTGFDGTVEAVRQASLAAQVAGTVVYLNAKAGDVVQAGQVLLRIDARAAEQSAAAGDAQVAAARASLEVATQEYDRQRQLYQKNYISQAALERAESNFKATRAQWAAQGAQANVARTQSTLHVVRAPFGAVVSDVPVSLGDMALPGRPLITLYDPSTMRVTAALPQSVAAGLVAGAPPRVELPGLPRTSQWPRPARLQVLPTLDAATHTNQVRVDLPSGLPGAVPGLFARLWLPLDGNAGTARTSVSVPAQAVVRRAEMTGLYVLDASGHPALRQVRLGRPDGDRIEILAGLAVGEQVVTNPAAAARVR